MNVEDIPDDIKQMTIPLGQAMGEAIFIRDSYLAEIEEHTDAETFQKIKKGVEKRQIARTLSKLDELSDVINEFKDDSPEAAGAQATVTNLSDYLKSKQ